MSDLYFHPIGAGRGGEREVTGSGARRGTEDAGQAGGAQYSSTAVQRHRGRLRQGVECVVRGVGGE